MSSEQWRKTASSKNCWRTSTRRQGSGGSKEGAHHRGTGGEKEAGTEGKTGCCGNRSSQRCHNPRKAGARHTRSASAIKAKLDDVARALVLTKPEFFNKGRLASDAWKRTGRVQVKLPAAGPHSVIQEICGTVDGARVPVNQLSEAIFKDGRPNTVRERHVRCSWAR